MTYAIERAIREGYESACHHKKDGEFIYHQNHPTFHYYWWAVVAKSDHRDWGLPQVTKCVLEQRRPAQRSVLY